MKCFLMSFFSLFFLVLICQDMKAILDGRTTSITIDYTYAFTNFEWARGHVKFNRGFDIPTNGTILLDVYESIDGNINFNNGTIIMLGDVIMGNRGRFFGPGYIEGLLFAGDEREFVLSNDITLTSTNKFFIKNDVKFRGKGGRPRMAFSASRGGLLDLTNARRVFFTDLLLSELHVDRFITSTTNPEVLIFRDCNLTTNSRGLTFDIFCPTAFAGDCLISGKTESTWSMSLMRIASFATVVVDVGITLEAETFEIVNQGAITLDNAVLDIRPTVTDDMPIAGINGGAGTFIFSGKSTLKSSTGNHLFTYPSYDLLFLSGSRLSLSEGTKFTIF